MKSFHFSFSTIKTNLFLASLSFIPPPLSPSTILLRAWNLTLGAKLIDSPNSLQGDRAGLYWIAALASEPELPMPTARHEMLTSSALAPPLLLPFHAQGALQSHLHFLPPTFCDSQRLWKGAPLYSLRYKERRIEWLGLTLHYFKSVADS